MVVLSAMFGILSAQEAPARTRVYERRETDVRFVYPAEWRFRRERLFDLIEFQSGGKTVRVQLIGTEFGGAKGQWQEFTRQVNEQNGRTVLRQWEEELLGVPLMLTRVRSGGGEASEVILTGLLMSRRKEKFLFRLTAPEAVAEEAERTWFSTLLNMTTLSGKLPDEELPAVAAGSGAGGAAAAGGSGRPQRVIVLRPETGGPVEVVRAPVRLVLAEAQGIFGYVPTGWALDTGEDGSLSLVKGGVRAGLRFGTGDDAAGSRELRRLVGERLSGFAVVSRRDALAPSANAAGFRVARTWRVGPASGGGEGEVAHWTGGGSGRGYWFVVDWQGPGAGLDAAREELDRLLQAMSLGAE